MKPYFLDAYKNDDETIAVQYIDEKQRRCTMFFNNCGNKLAGERLIELIKLSLPVEPEVMQSEATYTLRQILDAVRAELIASFKGDISEQKLKDKIYTVHGYIIAAVELLNHKIEPNDA